MPSAEAILVCRSAHWLLHSLAEILSSLFHILEIILLDILAHEWQLCLLLYVAELIK